MNVLIADDERRVCEYLSDMIESLPGCYDVGHAANGIEAVYKAYDLDIDVVLMDVRMPRMNGIEAARHINELANPPAVVFTTAYGEHALEAFGAFASGFLLKPIHPDKLIEVLSKLKPRSAHKVTEPAMFNEVEKSYICCRIQRGLGLLALNRVIYLKSGHKCTIIYHLGGCSISDQPLKLFEQQFDNRLLRVHRNALVNRAYVNGLKQGEDGIYFVLLRDRSEKLEISRRSLPRMREYLATFMKPRSIIRRREQFLLRHGGTKK